MQALHPIVATAFSIVNKTNTKALQVANNNVLVNAILYNPAAALQFLEQAGPGSARAFFDEWFAAISTPSRLPRVHDKKLSIMALCALMEMDPAGVPASIQDGFHNIVAGALQLFQEYPKAVQG